MCFVGMMQMWYVCRSTRYGERDWFSDVPISRRGGTVEVRGRLNLVMRMKVGLFTMHE